MNNYSRSLILILLSLFFSPSYGQVGTSETPCPNPKKVKNICLTIDGRTEDLDAKGKYTYMYQRMILDAACADEFKDSEEVIAEKIRNMWVKLADNMVCKSLNFDTPGAHVLKFAVSSSFDNFINDAIRWKVDLNLIDKKDNKTVLDYVKARMDSYEGSLIGDKMKIYYKMLRDAGAKHKSEL